MNNYPQRLFVYSSLRSGFQHPAYAYISKHFILESEALVKGKLFDLGNNIIGVPTSENMFIKGELYRIKNEDEFSWAFAQLDDYEGIDVEQGEIPSYIRCTTTAYVNNLQMETWVYWFNQPIEYGKLITSGDLLAYLREKK